MAMLMSWNRLSCSLWASIASLTKFSYENSASLKFLSFGCKKSKNSADTATTAAIAFLRDLIISQLAVTENHSILLTALVLISKTATNVC